MSKIAKLVREEVEYLLDTRDDDADYIADNPDWLETSKAARIELDTETATVRGPLDQVLCAIMDNDCFESGKGRRAMIETFVRLGLYEESRLVAGGEYMGRTKPILMVDGLRYRAW